jgi:phosphohistidine swiveling domain-containing protein
VAINVLGTRWSALSSRARVGARVWRAVSVEGATERIPDGALIEVDGAAGTVTILAASM